MAELPAWVHISERLRVDQWAAQVVSLFHERDIRPLLLKGPSIARWLYQDSEIRPYTDVDLMVAPASFLESRSILQAAGFVTDTGPVTHGWPYHAESWLRVADRAQVDLHWTFHGLETVRPDDVWRALSTRAESASVGGVSLEIPGEAARCLLVVLHINSSDLPGSQKWTDLERAIDQVPRSVWEETGELARRLGAEAAMGVRLRLLPGGDHLADELALPGGGTDEWRLGKRIEEGDLPARTCTVAQLAFLRGWRERVACGFRIVFPSPSDLRRQGRLNTTGAAGAALAYGVLVGRRVGYVPEAIMGWLRFRRSDKVTPSGR